jgi:hypothetical protein
LFHVSYKDDRFDIKIIEESRNARSRLCLMNGLGWTNLGSYELLYLRECFRILLSQASRVDNYDFTDSVLFFECTPAVS